MVHLEVIVGGKVLKEVALLLHDAVELVKVDLAITVTVGLVDHVLELLIIDVLTELLSHAGEVAEGDLVGVVVIEELEHLLVDTHVGNTFATTAVHFNGRKKPISAQNFKTIAEMRVIYDLKKENTFFSTQNASPTRNPNLKTGAKFRGISDFYLKIGYAGPDHKSCSDFVQPSHVAFQVTLHRRIEKDTSASSTAVKFKRGATESKTSDCLVNQGTRCSRTEISIILIIIC
jgi:hypothetical protein